MTECTVPADRALCECWKDPVAPPGDECVHPHPYLDIPGVNRKCTMPSFWKELTNLIQAAQKRAGTHSGIVGRHPLVDAIQTILQDKWCQEIYRFHFRDELREWEVLREWCGIMLHVLDADSYILERWQAAPREIVDFGPAKKQPPPSFGGEGRSEGEPARQSGKLLVGRSSYEPEPKLKPDQYGFSPDYIVRLACPLLYDVPVDWAEWKKVANDIVLVSDPLDSGVLGEIPSWSAVVVSKAWRTMRQLSEAEGRQPPGAEMPSEPENVSNARQARRALDDVRCYCRKMMTHSGNETDATSEHDEEALTWPRPEGWDFRSGQAAFDGHVFTVRRIAAKLLRKLAEAEGPVTKDDLKCAGWQDPNPDIVGDNVLRSQLSSLRSLLRREFSLPKTTDPIPHVDHGDGRAWKLADLQELMQSLPPT